MWLPEDAKVRPGVAGFVRVAHASDGERVHQGQLLFELEDPARIAEMSVLEARVRELEVEHAVEAFGDRVKAEIVAEQLATAREMLQRERDRTARLEVVSPTDGTLVVPGGAVLEGRYVHQGEELAVVVQGGAATVRAVVEQPDIALVRERPGPVQVQLADHVGQVLPARLAREVPAARYLLPSKVLGSEGGGQIPVEPGDSRGLKVTRKVFQVELQLADSVRAGAGQRVHVLFRHGTEPLLWQWTRRLQQVFLRRFAVGV